MMREEGRTRTLVARQLDTRNIISAVVSRVVQLKSGATNRRESAPIIRRLLQKQLINS